MSEELPRRVRVTGPARRSPPRSRTGEVEEQTDLGGLYLGSLLRAQLWLAVRTLGVLGLVVCLLPLLFFVLPDLAHVEVLGLPLAWLLLGVVAYPGLVLLGWWFLRRAEQHERDFVDLMRVVADEPPGGGPGASEPGP